MQQTQNLEDFQLHVLCSMGFQNLWVLKYYSNLLILLCKNKEKLKY